MTAGLRESAVALPSLGRSKLLAALQRPLGRSLRQELHGGIVLAAGAAASFAPAAQGTTRKKPGVRSQESGCGTKLLTSDFSPPMLLWLIQHAAVPSLLGAGKITVRAALAALASFLLAGVLGPRSNTWLARRFRAPIKRDSPEVCRLHAGKNATPTMGGLFIIAGVLGSVLLDGNLSNRYLLLIGGNSGIGFFEGNRRPRETWFAAAGTFRPRQTGGPVACSRGRRNRLVP